MQKALFVMVAIMVLILGVPALAEMEQTGYTTAVPASYQTTSSQPGTVEAVTYETRDYPRDAETVLQKTAYVYLPYGYDENDTETRYNSVYLMHGWGGHEGEYFQLANIKNMLDHMIENGDIPRESDRSPIWPLSSAKICCDVDFYWSRRLEI